MDNRRPTGTNNPATPYNQNQNQNRYYKKQDDRNYGERKFQPRADNRFPPRDNNSRDNNNNPRDNNVRSNNPRSDNPRYGRDNTARDNNTNRFPPRDDRFRGKDDRFPPRENRFQSRDERDRRNDRFPPRDGRDNRFPPRDERFAPRKNFIPRGKQVEPWKTPDKPKVYDEMQVTDGKLRGKFLKSTASPKVRPTARRIREVMFRLIFRRVRAGRVLDLCAGSGAVGIEAISRGALICTFVERSAKMCSFIKKNLEACGIKEGHGEICELEVVPFLKKMQKRRRFWDVVYFDPPYDTNYDEVLEYLKRGVAVKPGGLLVIEHHGEMFFPEKIGVLRRWRVINQGETALSFYERKG